MFIDIIDIWEIYLAWQLFQRSVRKLASALVLASLKGDFPILSGSGWFKGKSKGKWWNYMDNPWVLVWRIHAFCLFLPWNIELWLHIKPSRLRRKPKIMACDERPCPLYAKVPLGFWTWKLHEAPVQAVRHQGTLLEVTKIAGQQTRRLSLGWVPAMTRAQRHKASHETYVCVMYAWFLQMHM